MISTRGEFQDVVVFEKIRLKNVDLRRLVVISTPCGLLKMLIFDHFCHFRSVLGQKIRLKIVDFKKSSSQVFA